MNQPRPSRPADYPDDHAAKAPEDRPQPCLQPPLHPNANPNAEPGYLPGDNPGSNPAAAQPAAGGKADGASVVAVEHHGTLDEPVAVRPAVPAAATVLLEPHDEAPAEPYCDEQSAATPCNASKE